MIQFFNLFLWISVRWTNLNTFSSENLDFFLVNNAIFRRNFSAIWSRCKKAKNYFQVWGQDLSKYTILTSFVGMFVPITVVGRQYVIFSTKYKNVRTFNSFYEWFPHLFLLLMAQNSRIWSWCFNLLQI